MTQLGSTPEVRLMQKYKIPVTLKNWMEIVFPDGAPEGWEHDLDLPDELMKPGD